MNEARRRGSSWRRIRALSRKEFLQVLRDPSSVLIAFVLPLILLFLFGYGLSLDLSGIAFGVVVEDDSPEAASLARSFAASSSFAVRSARAVRPLEEDLVAGRIRGMLVIPQDFGRNLRSGRVRLQIVTDGSEPNTAAFVENYGRGVIRSWEMQRARETGRAVAIRIDLRPRIWFNPELQSRYSLLPGGLTIILAITGTLLTALVVSREWERGTMEAILATPVRSWEFLLSKVLPYFLLGMGSTVFSVAVSRLLFGLPFRGSAGALLLVSSAFLLTSLALGLLLSVVARSQFVAAQLAIILAFLPTTMLSGFIFEIDSMPGPLQLVTRLVPARYFVPSLRTILLTGDVWPVILPDVAVLLAMAALLFAVTLRRSGGLLEGS